MQAPSVALRTEMETEPCCEEHKDSSEEATKPDVRQATCESADSDGHTEMPCGSAEEGNDLFVGEQAETESRAAEGKCTEMKSPSEPQREGGVAECMEHRKLKKTNSWKMVRFQDPSQEDDVSDRDTSSESLFPEYALKEWTSSTFEELFMAEDWQDITEDRLLRKKVLKSEAPGAARPSWGQEVTVKMQCVLEDRTVVEKDCKLVFVIGEGDVNQALEECVISMQRGEISMLLADSLYAYGLLGREPDIPAWAPLLYQLKLLDFREKPDPLTLPVADRIRVGNQKRERGNFHFQREEFCLAARAYRIALDVLTTRSPATPDGGAGSAEAEAEEVRDYRVKCLNNLAAAQLKLEQFAEALQTSRDVLTLEPNNVKALFRAGKLLSETGEYKEAMEVLKKALKLEPATKAIHVELSKLVRRQCGGMDSEEEWTKPEHKRRDSAKEPPGIPSKKPTGISWKFILGALVVALGSLVTSVILTARN